MGANSLELSLDLAINHVVPKPISELLLKQVADVSEKSHSLGTHVRLLEEELRKIRSFERELPLSISLLSNAIKKLKEEMKDRELGRPQKEESASDFSEMKNWMSTAQLWGRKEESLTIAAGERPENGFAMDKPFLPCNLGNKGGAFLPFSRQQPVRVMVMTENDKEEEEEEVLVNKGLSISMTEAEMDSVDLKLGSNSDSSGSGLVSGSGSGSFSGSDKQVQKPRRCWSPELHRRFVDALKQLGGPQTATPKHIKELMQVDGLTNDEVKSHLQKYRIHIRKMSSSQLTFTA